MPYAPGTEYRGDQYIFQGGRQTAEALTGWLQNFLNQEKQVNSLGKSADYFVKANQTADGENPVLSEMGIHADEWANLGAREKSSAVNGLLQSRGDKRAAADAQAQTQLRQAEAAKAKMETDAAGGFPDFAKYLNEELAKPTAAPQGMPPGVPDWQAFLNGGGPRSFVQTPGAPGGADTATANNGTTMPQAVLRALARVQAMRPEVAAAIASRVLPQMIQNAATGEDSTPETMTAPDGTMLAFQRHTKNPLVVLPSSKANANAEAQIKVNDAKNKNAGSVTLKDQYQSLLKQTIELRKAKATALTPEDKQQYQAEIDALNGQMGQLVPGKGAATPASAPAKTPTVKSQADYDALESGAMYLDKNGKKFRKP